MNKIGLVYILGDVFCLRNGYSVYDFSFSLNSHFTYHHPEFKPFYQIPKESLSSRGINKYHILKITNKKKDSFLKTRQVRKETKLERNTRLTKHLSKKKHNFKLPIHKYF